MMMFFLIKCVKLYKKFWPAPITFILKKKITSKRKDLTTQI